MNKSLIKIVFTDLDGTLLNAQQKISVDDLNLLNKLKDKKIIRVLATGRNLYSLSKVIPDNFPVDFVIFSTGAGILDWKSKKLIHSMNLEEARISEVRDILVRYKTSFMLQHKVPENHRFYYQLNGKTCPDFFRRIEIYRELAEEVKEIKAKSASQFLAVFEDLQEFLDIKSQLNDVKIIRATSPIDHQSIWMEIFHREVSKGNGCKWLCNHLSIEQESTVGIGNDFNDLDMLHWTRHSFVVDNSHVDLKNKFQVTNHHNESALSEVLKNFI